MSKGLFKRVQSSPMLTVVHDTDTSWFDNRLLASRQYAERHPDRKHAAKQRMPFVQNPKWRRCFSGWEGK